MSIGSGPLNELVIPDGTAAEERDLVTEGDVIVGGQSTIEFGIRGRNVLAGERVQIHGGIEAGSDCRLDMWCDVDGDVLVGKNAYLGERVHIAGQLMVSGDLDIGDDVQIDEGFEANGWIVIRNPMPMIVFLFVYLSQLLRIGEQEAAEQLLSDLVDEEDVDENPMVIPRGSRISDEVYQVSTPARIGNECRLHGNIRAETIVVGTDTTVFGSLRARGDIAVDAGTTVHGDVTTRGGTVTIDDDVHILGDISCEDLVLHRGARIDGTIRATGEMRIATDGEADSKEVEAESESEDEPSDGDGKEEGEREGKEEDGSESEDDGEGKGEDEREEIDAEKDGNATRDEPKEESEAV